MSKFLWLQQSSLKNVAGNIQWNLSYENYAYSFESTQTFTHMRKCCFYIYQADLGEEKKVDKRVEFQFSLISSGASVSFTKSSYRIKPTVKHQKELYTLCFVILKTLKHVDFIVCMIILLYLWYRSLSWDLGVRQMLMTGFRNSDIRISYFFFLIILQICSLYFMSLPYYITSISHGN